jgi:hypothetical protein
VSGLDATAYYKAQALRLIAERLQDRPVEVMCGGLPADYGLTDEEAEAAQLELLAELEALADRMDPEGAYRETGG